MNLGIRRLLGAFVPVAALCSLAARAQEVPEGFVLEGPFVVPDCSTLEPGLSGLDLRMDWDFYVGYNHYALDAARFIYPGAPLREADLCGFYLGLDVDLRGADLVRANLKGAYLQRADLSGAFLNGARFTGADLIMADLTGADLRAADMRGASWAHAYLAGALFNEHTRLPEDWGATELERVRTAIETYGMRSEELDQAIGALAQALVPRCGTDPAARASGSGAKPASEAAGVEQPPAPSAASANQR